jgi:hypothetical protein
VQALCQMHPVIKRFIRQTCGQDQEDRRQNSHKDAGTEVFGSR